MALWQGKSVKTPSGGKLHLPRKKRVREIGLDPVNPKIGTKATKRKKRVRGGKQITQILTATHANLNLGENKFKQSKIITVKENPANRHFVRMNVVAKGAVVETEDGLAKVTSRPSRDGIVNAVLIK